MDLPFLLGRQFLPLIPQDVLEPLAIGAVSVGTLAFLWWVRHITGVPGYRSFRATTHAGSRQAVVALGATLGVAAALIVIAPLIAGILRG